MRGRGWWRQGSRVWVLLIDFFFPLKLTQPTLIGGGRSELRKWWNVKGTYLEEGGGGVKREGWGGEGGGDGKSNTF